MKTLFQHEEVERFVRELSQEVEKRLKDISKKASQITLKVSYDFISLHILIN